MAEKRNFIFERLANKIAMMIYLFNAEWPFAGRKSSLLVKHGWIFHRQP
jgi:hypothetical protein